MLVRAIRSQSKFIQHVRFFYDARTRNDTIYAPSTEINTKTGSPIGIVRLSGSRTNQVISKLTDLCTERDSSTINSPPTIRARYATVTRVKTPSTGELIDVGMVLWFPKPRSYTGEDVCEFHLHGSQVIMRAMMETLGTIDGLRPAEPGEFTRRAVMNGKMSLFQAESLHDLITSQTDHQRKIALKGLDGSTRSKYEEWIKKLIGILAHLEASIDFGEDELIGEESTINNCIQNLISLSVDIRQFIELGTKSRDIARNGIRIAILGKPNVGKSTLMNLLCRCDKSIVSDLSGTTRDVVEHRLELGGHAVTLCDTAGLKKYYESSKDTELSQLATPEAKSLKELILQHNQIEQEGVKRAIETATKCNVVLYLVDGRKFSTNINELSKELIQELKNVLQQSNERESKLVHIIVNKIDLISGLTKVDSVNLSEVLISSLNIGCNLKVHLLSCKTRLNFQELVDQLIVDMNNLVCCSKPIDESNLESKHVMNELSYINERHLSLLKSSHRHLEKAAKLSIVTVDEMAQHVREALDYLSRIVGLVSNEQVFDVIFKDFCIGK